jgi:hypothetical protein
MNFAYPTFKSETDPLPRIGFDCRTVNGKMFARSRTREFQPCPFCFGIFLPATRSRTARRNFSRSAGLSMSSLRWFRKAAEQNYADAQYILGVCYDSGEGVAKDEIEAYKWWLLAAGHGNDDAKYNITIVENKMTGADRGGTEAGAGFQATEGAIRRKRCAFAAVI